MDEQKFEPPAEEPEENKPQRVPRLGEWSNVMDELFEQARRSSPVDVPQLQGDFQDRFHELIGELRPELTKVSLGGRLLLDGVAHQVGETWALDLSVIPADVSVAWGDDARIEGLTGRLRRAGPKDGETRDEGGEE